MINSEGKTNDKIALSIALDPLVFVLVQNATVFCDALMHSLSIIFLFKLYRTSRTLAINHYLIRAINRGIINIKTMHNKF